MTFQKGQSGNPSGRRPGTGHVARLRAQIEKELPTILDGLLARAQEGDPKAAKLLLERTLPALRPETRPPPKGFLDPREIPGAVGEGRLTPEQGILLLDLAAKAASLGELEELRERLGALERLVNHEPG